MQKTIGWGGSCVFMSIGTIIHELSHFLTALLFLHTPTRVELFRPIKGKQDGCLGFVEHSYKKTTYRTAGNFFIGCAPMILGSAINILLFRLINIDVINVMDKIVKKPSWNRAKVILKQALLQIDYKNPVVWFIIFIILSITISMNMSGKDFENSLVGFFAMWGLTGMTYCLVSWFYDINIFLALFQKFTYGYIMVLFLGFCFCIITFIVSFIAYFIKRLVKKV
jgi:hypothetical protein